MRTAKLPARLAERKKEIQRCSAILLLLFFSVYLALFVFYISIAGSTVPIMDFWRYILHFGPSNLQNSQSLVPFFQDGGEHSQAIPLFLDFLVLRRHNYDVQPLLYYGSAFLSAQGIILLISFLIWNRNRTHPYYFLAGGILTVLVAFNYNSWEMYTEPFSMMTPFRTLFYFLLFLAIDRVYRSYSLESGRKALICNLVLAVLLFFVAVYFSAAYMSGFLLAFLLLTVIWSISRRKVLGRRVLCPLLISVFTAAISFAVYFFQTRQLGGQSVSALTADFLEIIRGFLIGLGSSFLHQNMSIRYKYIAGWIILIWVLFLLIQVFRNPNWAERELFPLLCLFYGGIILAVICIGRVGPFGAEYISSSRYTVETGFGLLGLIWLTCDTLQTPVFKNKALNWIVQVLSVLCLSVLMFGLVYSAAAEWHIAPYRGAYYRQLAEIMMNIDSYSDDQLVVFQSEPEIVRSAIQFLRINNLSIFR